MPSIYQGSGISAPLIRQASSRCSPTIAEAGSSPRALVENLGLKRIALALEQTDIGSEGAGASGSSWPSTALSLWRL